MSAGRSITPYMPSWGLRGGVQTERLRRGTYPRPVSPRDARFTGFPDIPKSLQRMIEPVQDEEGAHRPVAWNLTTVPEQLVQSLGKRKPLNGSSSAMVRALCMWKSVGSILQQVQRSAWAPG
ncbi:uncharacterized protein LOC124185829 [Neodiprion fabricii]|uniref:uncharacterized protein LOC124185829 n=1 Tax=Neodiprion fabricii TaxID=2872261 RepID=UPI001ED8E33E|nr:uncharacterized protein LOC124185829 [Neodiprion fabricii]